MKKIQAFLKRNLIPLDLIGYSNLFLALGAFCSTIQGSLIFTNYKESCLFFAIINFSAAFYLYNLQRLFQSYQPKVDARLDWYRNNRLIITLLGCIISVSCGYYYYTAIIKYSQSLYFYSISGLISILYFLPPFELRKIAFLKIFYIAFIWVVVCSLIPFLFQKEKYLGFDNFTLDHWLYIGSQFCFIATICLPFDIRDIKKDRDDKVGSFPVKIGIRNTKIFAILLMTGYLLLSLMIEIKSLFIIRGLIFLTTLAIIFYSNPERHRYYFIYLTDGLLIFQAVILFLFL